MRAQEFITEQHELPPESEEPDFVQDKSPIRPFKGYPR